jgi:hypothetical protein
MTNEVGFQSPMSSPIFSERVRSTLIERLKLHQRSRRRRRSDSEVQKEENEEDHESKNRWKKSRTTKDNIARVITFPKSIRQEEQFSRKHLQQQHRQEKESSPNEVKKAGDSLEFVNQMMDQISQENMIKWSFDFCERNQEQEEVVKQTTSQVPEGQRNYSGSQGKSCRQEEAKKDSSCLPPETRIISPADPDTTSVSCSCDTLSANHVSNSNSSNNTTLFSQTRQSTKSNC